MIHQHGIPIIEVRTMLCKDSVEPNIKWYESVVTTAAGQQYHFRQWFRVEEFLVGSFVEYILRAQVEGLKEVLDNTVSLGERYTP